MLQGTRVIKNTVHRPGPGKNCTGLGPVQSSLEPGLKPVLMPRSLMSQLWHYFSHMQKHLTESSITTHNGNNYDMQCNNLPWSHAVCIIADVGSRDRGWVRSSTRLWKHIQRKAYLLHTSNNNKLRSRGLSSWSYMHQNWPVHSTNWQQYTMKTLVTLCKHPLNSHQ